jgi:hypothetical protein
VEGHRSPEGTWKYRKLSKSELGFIQKLYFAVPDSHLKDNGGAIEVENALSDIAMDDRSFKRALYESLTQTGRATITLSDEPNEFGLTLEDLLPN